MSATDPFAWIVTKAEFADIRGCSKAYVSKLISQQRLGMGLRADGRVDVIAAYRALGEVAPLPRFKLPEFKSESITFDDCAQDDPSKTDTDDLDSAVSAPSAEQVKVPPDAVEEPATAIYGSAQNSGHPVPGTEYADARARREVAAARMAELALAEAERRLIDRTVAEQTFEDLARRFQGRILSVAAEVAEDCARLDEAIKVEARVTSGIEAALLELSRPVMDDAI